MDLQLVDSHALTTAHSRRNTASHTSRSMTIFNHVGRWRVWLVSMFALAPEVDSADDMLGVAPSFLGPALRIFGEIKKTVSTKVLTIGSAGSGQLLVWQAMSKRVPPQPCAELGVAGGGERLKTPSSIYV